MKTKRKKKPNKDLLMAQMMPNASFGPVFLVSTFLQVVTYFVL